MLCLIAINVLYAIIIDISKIKNFFKINNLYMKCILFSFYSIHKVGLYTNIIVKSSSKS